MALAHAAQSPIASISNAAGDSKQSAWLPTNAGVSGVGKVTNGGTGPTLGCDFVVEISNDNGTTVLEWSRQTAGVTASGVYRFPFALGIGSGADAGYYRITFTGNSAQAVTVQCDAGTTTV